jgi:hypothetical protein
MYSSLDRVDIELKGDNGYIQTDHRTSSELEQDKAISIVFAIIRVLNPMRMGRQAGKKAIVRYTFTDEMPPLFMQEAIVSAGGVPQFDGTDIPFSGQRVNVDSLLNQGMQSIAHDKFEKKGYKFLPEHLRFFEARLIPRAQELKENEIAYWRTVIMAGAYAGEVLRNLVGGNWRINFDASSTLPITFDVGGAAFNLTGKAIKLLENGETDSLAAMINVALKMRQEGKI